MKEDGEMDLRYHLILHEQEQKKLDLIVENVTQIPAIKQDIQELKEDVKILKFDVKILHSDMRDVEDRLARLES